MHMAAEIGSVSAMQWLKGYFKILEVR